MGTIPALKDKNGRLAYLKTHHWVWWLRSVILAEAGGLPSVKASLGYTLSSSTVWDIA